MASQPLSPIYDLLEFTPAVIQPMIDIGKADADTIVKTTKPGESFKQVDDWVDSVRLQERYPDFADYLYRKEITI